MFGHDHNDGLAYFALKQIFSKENEFVKDLEFFASFTEVFNEQANDLLSNKQNLSLREDEKGQFFVNGL